MGDRGASGESALVFRRGALCLQPQHFSEAEKDGRRLNDSRPRGCEWIRSESIADGIPAGADGRP